MHLWIYKVEGFFDTAHPEYVILAAGKVGGIVENKTYPAEFITRNLAVQLNVIRSAHTVGVKRFILFGSSCMYPRECSQPMLEVDLLSGCPESTSMSYAIAKLAGVQMCLAYNQQFGYKRTFRLFLTVSLAQTIILIRLPAMSNQR
ncbi:NAD-dependent epimerase/dehydratase family protein [Methylotuvimicrobium sp. KM1]|uniref:NAD-dependent epimerase/dehydratase family protein n=1 Tax=Methylotuvimicrobium sp. KM1 TaxID=3377707 RepID=UPI00384C7545